MLNPTTSKVAMTAEDTGREWCLTFEYTFRVDHDDVGFACQPPYTHAYLLRQLSVMPRVSQLCTSLLGLSVPLLTLQPRIGKSFRSVALAIARQHPGEAVGSWMIDGFLQELLQKDEEVLWVVVPMLNPDGVYFGNSRTGVAGYDYNRLYNQDEPSIADRDRLVPEVAALLTLVKKLKRKYGSKLKLFIDFHGHSTRQNVFAYGPPYTAAGTDQFITGMPLHNTVSSTLS